MNCIICGRAQNKLRKQRCTRCYSYLWGTGRERPVSPPDSWGKRPPREHRTNDNGSLEFTCTVCKKWKAENDFSADKRKPSGRQFRCRACMSLVAAQQVRAAPEKIEDDLTEKERHSARRKFNKAVRSGNIVRPTTCSQCGRVARIYGHHKDYRKPFDVEWLCCRCHMARHTKLPKYMNEWIN
jgi:hypothetical protein